MIIVATSRTDVREEWNSRRAGAISRQRLRLSRGDGPVTVLLRGEPRKLEILDPELGWIDAQEPA